MYYEDVLKAFGSFGTLVALPVGVKCRWKTPDMLMRYVVGAPQAGLSGEGVRPGATAFPLERSSRSGSP